MSRATFIVLCLLLLYTLQVDSIPSSRDLLDQAEEQLEKLRSVMRFEIYSSLSKIDLLVRDFFQHRNAAQSDARVDLLQEYDTLLNHLTIIKNEAEVNNVDISVCLNNQEKTLDTIRNELDSNINMCYYYATEESTTIRIDTTYRIDILINHVVIFEFQLDKCQGDFLCIEPIINEIELAVATYPQKVDLELEKAAGLMEKLKVWVSECYSSEVAEMSAEGHAIVATVLTCAGNITT